jgi:hypothetical protein
VEYFLNRMAVLLLAVRAECGFVFGLFYIFNSSCESVCFLSPRVSIIQSAK